MKSHCCRCVWIITGWGTIEICEVKKLASLSMAIGCVIYMCQEWLTGTAGRDPWNRQTQQWYRTLRLCGSAVPMILWRIHWCLKTPEILPLNPYQHPPPPSMHIKSMYCNFVLKCNSESSSWTCWWMTKASICSSVYKADHVICPWKSYKSELLCHTSISQSIMVLLKQFWYHHVITYLTRSR